MMLCTTATYDPGVAEREGDLLPACSAAWCICMHGTFSANLVVTALSHAVARHTEARVRAHRLKLKFNLRLRPSVAFQCGGSVSDMKPAPCPRTAATSDMRA